MRNRISRDGQTVIPSELRRRYGLDDGSEIEWIDTGQGLKVTAVVADPIAALRGRGRGEKLVERLIRERHRGCFASDIAAEDTSKARGSGDNVARPSRF